MALCSRMGLNIECVCGVLGDEGLMEGVSVEEEDSISFVRRVRLEGEGEEDEVAVVEVE